MKKIKILGETIVSRLFRAYKAGNAMKGIEARIHCPKIQRLTDIDCKPIYFFRNWDEKKLPSEGGASFAFHDGTNLTIVSVMEDSDVFSDAALANDRTWEKGDTLEVFIQPSSAKAYFELHVAPNLATLELAIPDPDGLRAKKYRFEDLFFDSGSEFGASAVSFEDFNGWWGLISVPAERISLDLSGGSSAKFAICRYNFQRGKKKPECSSSAPFSMLDFHKPEEWQTLEF